MQAFRIGVENGNLPHVGVGLRSISPAVPQGVNGGAAVVPPVCGGGGSVASGSSKGRALVGEREVDYENRTILFCLFCLYVIRSHVYMSPIDVISNYLPLSRRLIL